MRSHFTSVNSPASGGRRRWWQRKADHVCRCVGHATAAAAGWGALVKVIGPVKSGGARIAARHADDAVRGERWSVGFSVDARQSKGQGAQAGNEAAALRSLIACGDVGQGGRAFSYAAAAAREEAGRRCSLAHVAVSLLRKVEPIRLQARVGLRCGLGIKGLLCVYVVILQSNREAKI